MPNNVIGSTSEKTSITLDTSSFVQKAYLGTNYFDGNIEEDVVSKNLFKNKNLPIDLH